MCFYILYITETPAPHLTAVRLLISNRVVSKVSDLMKDRNSQNGNVGRKSTDSLYSLSKLFWLNTALKLKKKVVPPLHWLLPFYFEWCQGTVQQRAPPEEEHKPSGSCQLLNLVVTLNTTRGSEYHVHNT